MINNNHNRARRADYTEFRKTFGIQRYMREMKVVTYSIWAVIDRGCYLNSPKLAVIQL